MFVYVLMGKRKGGELYVIAVFRTEAYALEKKRRWEKQHPGGIADVQRFSVVNGNS